MQVAFIWLVRWVSCATRSTWAGSRGAIRTSRASDARKSSRLGEERAARARSARWAYISPRRRSSSVTRARSKAQTWARKAGISVARGGKSSASTWGTPACTSRTSLGLSSTRMKVSRPRSSSSAREARLPALESQLTRRATKSPGRERHLGRRGECGGHLLFIILAAQGAQHALTAALRHELLERAARRVEHDAFGTVLAANAGPQGIVAIA